MSDLQNDFPSWGESGEYPQDGFFYEDGDQVNEKHFDALWNGVEEHIANINTAIRDRVRDLDGDTVLDGGMVASSGSGTREVDVSASTEGAYVDGHKTGSTSATTVTLSANGTGSTRTDSVWVDVDGNIGSTEGTTSIASDRHKIAEVDVNTSDSITEIRNTGRDHIDSFATETAPSSGAPGDIWMDLINSRFKIYQSGAFRTVATSEDILTINTNNGITGGASGNIINGITYSLAVDISDLTGNGIKNDGTDSLTVEPADFAGHGLEDDGSDNLRIDGATIGAGIIGGDGVNLELDESTIIDGGAKELDASEFAGGLGTSGQFLTTDGSAASWGDAPGISTSEDGTEIITNTTEYNFGYGVVATDEGNQTAKVETDENEIQNQTILWSEGYMPNFMG